MHAVNLAAILALIVLAIDVASANPPKKQVCCSSNEVRRCQFEDSCSASEQPTSDKCCPPTSDKSCRCNKTPGSGEA